MASILVPYLRTRARGQGGVIFYYWCASPALARAGWKTLTLGTDEQAAITAARARNLEVDAWRTGGGAPQEVKKHVRAETLDALIALYTNHEAYTALRASTRREYANKLRIIAAWAGDAPLASITADVVEAFYRALRRPTPDGVERATRAASTMRMFRTLMKFARKKRLIGENPLMDVKIKTPAARAEIWELEQFDAFCAAAERIRRPSLRLAARVGLFMGQRPGDIIAMGWKQWQDRRITIRQSKTRKWVGVRAVEQLAAEIDAEYAPATNPGGYRAHDDRAQRRNRRAVPRRDVRAAHASRTSRGGAAR